MLNIKRTTNEVWMRAWLFNPFMHNVVKWPNGVNTARFLKYDWPFYNIMHERVKYFFFRQLSTLINSWTGAWKIDFLVRRVVKTWYSFLVTSGCLLSRKIWWAVQICRFWPKIEKFYKRGDHMEMYFEYFQIQKGMLETERKK